MVDRRKFLCASGQAALLGALGALAFAQAHKAGPAGHGFGLQLFTLFDVLDADVQGTLRKVAQLGYRDLQSSYSKQAGMYGMTPRAFAAMVGELGMTWSSHHVPGEPRRIDPAAKPFLDASGKPRVFARALNLRDNMQEIIDYVADGGPRYLVCAGVPTATLKEVDASIALLNRAGEACKKAGLMLSLHNHETEFRPLGGTTPYEMILKGTSPDHLTMELDIAWAVKAGVDPVVLFQRYPGRFGLWHVKDIDDKRLAPLPLGQGIIDFRSIFDHAKTAGMAHYYVEHDFPADPMASIATSLHYLQRILGQP
ncbi:sugar phosphate isomerase/epimerase family protein [Massilia niastensis]|uniref:sugar phosphate isomerase/epimerase family protein n=1 Tax=Massilia niastensis TaxID=544911 RepID=UPI00036EEB66|nr:TIM barrel protein [Massilia niastensis]